MASGHASPHGSKVSLRKEPGARPNSRLNARLKAASDSYPISWPISATECCPSRSRSAASSSLHGRSLRRTTMVMGNPAAVETCAPTVQAAQPDDTQRGLDTLTLAFAAAPAVRWMYPDPQQYPQGFPAFAHAFGGRAMARR